MGKSKVLISAILLLLWFLTIGCALPPEIEKGDKAFQAGNYDEAIANYQKAVQNYPNEPEYHKKWKEALKKGAQYHFDKGQEYRKKKFLLQKAIEEYTKALDYQPDFIKARKARSEVRAYINLLKWKIKLAKKALELKDWFRAEKLLWLHRKYTPTLPEIQEIWHKAAKESFALYMAEGLRYYSLERYKQALKYFEEAYRLFPEDESCKKKLEITKKKYQSHQLVLQTLEEMKNNNFSKARALSKKALELDPENKQALQFLQEATRNRAKKLLQQGLKFMNQDKLVEAYKSILKAIALKPPGKLLKKDLEDKKKHLQKKIAAKLYLLADKLERKGLYAAAWVRFKSIQDPLIWPGFANVASRLDKLDKKIKEALHYRLVVIPKGGNPKRTRAGMLKKLAKTLTAELQKSLEPKFFTVFPYIALDGKKVKGQPISGILTIYLDQFDILFIPKPQMFTKSYIAAVGKELVPEKQELWKKMIQAKKKYESWKSKWAAAQAKLQELQKSLDQAKKDLEDFLRKNPPKKTLTPQEEASDPRSIQIGKLKTVIQTRELALESFRKKDYTITEQKYKEAKINFENLREAYLKTPVFKDKKFVRQYRYTLWTITKTGTVQCKIIWKDYISGEDFLEESFFYSVSAEDKVQKGFSPAGIPEDPLQLPSNEKISQQLLEGVIQKILAKVKEKSHHFQKRFEVAMENVNPEEGVHYAVLAYFARKNPAYRIRYKLKKEIDQKLVDFILKETGFHLASNQLDLDSFHFPKN